MSPHSASIQKETTPVEWLMQTRIVQPLGAGLSDTALEEMVEWCIYTRSRAAELPPVGPDRMEASSEQNTTATRSHLCRRPSSTGHLVRELLRQHNQVGSLNRSQFWFPIYFYIILCGKILIPATWNSSSIVVLVSGEISSELRSSVLEDRRQETTHGPHYGVFAPSLPVYNGVQRIQRFPLDTLQNGGSLPRWGCTQIVVFCITANLRMDCVKYCHCC